MNWFGGEGAGAEDGLAAGLLTNIRFDAKDPDSYFNWHETRGIPRAELEALFREPNSKLRDLEQLYRKAGVNIRDLEDLLDEAADSTTLAAVFAKNKRAYAGKPVRRLWWQVVKATLGSALVIAAIFLLALPFLKSCE